MSIVDQWNAARLEDRIAYFSAAVSMGHGVQITSEPSTSRNPGEINGLASIPTQTPFSRQVAERAERRASTANV